MKTENIHPKDLTLKQMQKQRELGNSEFWQGVITCYLNSRCDTWITQQK